MSRIAELIEELCPNGVVHLSMGATGTFTRGSGIQKKDFLEQGFPAIHYGQIFTRYGLWASETYIFVDEAVAGKSKLAQPGDVVIATTSENDEDLAKAVAWIGNSPVAVSSDAMIYSPENLNPKFVSYFLNSTDFQKQKEKFITGTKVRRISSQNFSKIKIPVPPLEIQEEIVRILDRFTLLEAELEAELEARRKQYAFYRDSLLNFENRGGQDDVPWKCLADISFIGTGSRNTNQATSEGKYPFYVRSQTPLAIDFFDFDEKAIITAGDGVGVGKVFHYQDGKYALHQRAYRIVIQDPSVEPKFAFYYIQNNFKRYLEKTAVHASVTSLRKPMFEKYQIPVPSVGDQQRIVKILDKFDDLVNDISSGLPAEIAARRKQYEHYRDKLLTFKELQPEAA
ncbi:restriction endonuclease subunit S [Rothia nasimurium]|uniref:restriction endonuclease subunit S n=1 Tax=Rothia nasimurium TaxID=85336 RepID=UPI001F16527D|nr:restriction endonuclease subunit S [Rothia nasimurium]